MLFLLSTHVVDKVCAVIHDMCRCCVGSRTPCAILKILAILWVYSITIRNVAICNIAINVITIGPTIRLTRRSTLI